MRLPLESALLVCLCLWIPVAQSYGAPEDEDGSGDDEMFSGSGSGDNDLWLSDPDVITQASPNTTKTVWYTDAPVSHPGHSVTQLVMLDPEPETSGHITEAPFLYTTQITKTQPPLVIIKTLGSEKDQEAASTTVSSVAQPVTTVPPAEKPPVKTAHEEEHTTADYNVEDTTESSVVEEEKETEVFVEAVPMTKAPDMETSTPALRTTSASNSADIEASGDAVESTTVQGIVDNFIEENMIEENVMHKPKMVKPEVDDFGFENEIVPKSENPGSNSGFSQGSPSDNDSLLERKEVLAGVIAGGVVGLAFAIMLVALMVYRMKKKDEGSYSLDEHKHPNGGYQKPQKQEEFLA